MFVKGIDLRVPAEPFHAGASVLDLLHALLRTESTPAWHFAQLFMIIDASAITKY
jgi:hypothetical protein